MNVNIRTIYNMYILVRVLLFIFGYIYRVFMTLILIIIFNELFLIVSIGIKIQLGEILNFDKVRSLRIQVTTMYEIFTIHFEFMIV